MKRRNILRYISAFPCLTLISQKYSYACSMPTPTYITTNLIKGSARIEKTKYLIKTYNSTPKKDTKNIISSVINHDNGSQDEFLIPFSIAISNLSPNEACIKIDVHAVMESKYEPKEKSIFCYKVGSFSFYKNSIPYISSRFKAMGNGSSLKILTIATIMSNGRTQLLQNDSEAVYVDRCNSYIFR